MSKLTGAALDRAVANALGLKSVNNCEKWQAPQPAREPEMLTIAYQSGYHDGKKAAQRKWVGLTAEEIEGCLHHVDDEAVLGLPDFARAVEQLLKEKNNGL